LNHKQLIEKITVHLSFIIPQGSIEISLFKQFRHLRHDGNTLKKAKKFVFLTGAGISQESGISTFRGKDGIKYDIPVDRVGAYFGERKEIREITTLL